VPGYVATSTTQLALALGSQTLLTQSALAYLAEESITLTYAQNTGIYMSGTVTAYNAVTGSMTVNITFVQTGGLQLQPIWNTQPWGSGGGLLNSWLLTLIGGVKSATVPVTPTILVRTLNADWDAQRGNGLSNFLTDVNAVAQIIAQRLKLFQGEWFANTSLGVPWFQNILGQSTTTQAVSLIIREQILAVPYVTGITQFNCTYSATRSFSFSATVSTLFGDVSVGS
jgi:hypothetical protein